MAQPLPILSQNHQIVNLFLCDFYRNRRIELVEIIASNFRYRSPFFGEVEFDEYLVWMNRFSSIRSVTKKTTPHSIDDMVFRHKFWLKVLDFGQGFEEEMLGTTTIVINNGLIEKVDNIYADESLNPDRFAKVKAKLLGYL